MSRKNLGVVGLGVALAVAVGLLAITLLVRGNDSTNEAARDTSTNGRSPEIPDSVASSNDRTDGSLLDHGPDLDVYTLAWDELIEE